ncbi:MAG TPA: NBR1-Ig-like domain-containing protein [Anaerolineales bacterium]|nr:NBR1-Ig-like domain-containing protein [Anaerolineales bacterium]
MHRSSKAITFVSLLALIASSFQVIGVQAQKAAALSYCDQAQFVTDVTVPDGTGFYWGVTFQKTWRLKNVSTCTWTTSYNLVYVGGSQMGAPSVVPFPQSVAPGQTVDLTVPMTAPSAPGTFIGYWELQDPSGAYFGIGSGYSHSFWVKITTTTPQQLVTSFDFTQNICSAQWSYDGGPIPCPMNTTKLNYGYVQVLDNPTLETGVGAGAPSLLTVPQNKFNGSIRGTYQVSLVPGDHFQTTIGCEYQAYSCFATFELDYLNGSSLVTLWRAREKYDGLVYPVDIDLTSISHARINGLVLIVSAYGDASGDLPIWVAPRIVRYLAGPVVTPTPGGPGAPTYTPYPGSSPTPFSASSCDRAQFVSDVSVPDGTTFTPNTSFTKTWRLQNVGTCTWTTAYNLIFVSGDRMSAPASVLLPQTVVPGQTVDVGVNLTAPPTGGEFRGYWELADPSGAVFGIGPNADKPFWVDIRVSGTATTSSAAYDFAANLCQAQWMSGAGSLPCPGSDGDARGFVLGASNPQLENGNSSNAQGMITFPQNTYNGYIRGVYPPFMVQSGDHFQSIVDCAYGVTQCFVVFRLDYQVNGGIVQTFWSWAEKYDGLYYAVNLDLSPLAGQNVNFILTVLSNGDPTGDRAVWVAPQIVRSGAGGAVPTLAPTNIPTNTPVPATPTPAPPTPTAAPSATNTPQPGTLTYVNQTYGFEFNYPIQGLISNQTATGAHITLPFAPGTNLVEKYLDVNVATNAATCSSPQTQGYAPGSYQSQQVAINGINFVKQSGEEGTAGSVFDWVAYSTLKGTNCISLSFTLHSSDPGVYPTPPPTFDMASESAVFLNIVSSFAFLGP